MDLLYRIGGQWMAGEAGEGLVDTSPSDVREVLAHYRHTSIAQVDAAMGFARDAFPVWRRTPGLERASVLSRAASLLRERSADCARVVSLENGKTLVEATAEVRKSADILDFYAATARLPYGGILPDARTGTRVMSLIEPIGVIVMVTPWNDPVLTPARKLAPALVTGNTVVLKPASETPLATHLLVTALIDAGLPPGVLNTVLTDHDAFDRAVLGHPQVAGVTFTGSTAVGRGLSRKLAGRNVRLQTEMGGKNASVVLADADLDVAVSAITASGLGQAGQRCTATSRILVENPVYDRFLDAFSASVAALRLGHSLDPATSIGPVASRRHRDSILRHISRARNEGAEIVLGGGVPADERLANGCFVEPTIATVATTDSALWHEEVFGPVLAVRRVSSIREAVDAVNDSEYGLAAAIFTSSLRHAENFIHAVDTGQVAVNLPTSGWDVHQPFGGFKDSGSPFKEQGEDGLRFYTRTKTAAVRFDW